MKKPLFVMCLMVIAVPMVSFQISQLTAQPPDLENDRPPETPNAPGAPEAPLVPDLDVDFSQPRNIRREVRVEVRDGVERELERFDAMSDPLEREARELSRAYRQERNEARRDDIAGELRRVTEKAFAKKLEQRREQIERMRRQLEEAAERLEQRERLADQIIDRRMSDLLGQRSELDWDLEPLPGMRDGDGARRPSVAKSFGRWVFGDFDAERMEREIERATAEASLETREAAEKARIEIEKALEEASEFVDEEVKEKIEQAREMLRKRRDRDR